MALIVEDGSGVPSAASYATVAYINSYWEARPHDPNFATWDAADDENKEGAAREATEFLDAEYGSRFKGRRRGYAQGLQWPRSGALDAAGYPLPDLPDALRKAVAELAVRALSERLAPDADRGNAVKSETKTVGPITKSVTYMDAAPSRTRYSAVEGLISDLLSDVGGASWAWR